MFRGEKAIEFESTLERDFLVCKEFFLDTLDVVPQPCQIHYRDTSANCTRLYTPDFLIRYKSKSRSHQNDSKLQLIEVKPEMQWRKHWRKWLPKWKAAYSYAKSRGWQFRVYDENRIRNQVFKNIMFLQPYKRMTFLSEESQVILQTIHHMGSVSIKHLLAKFCVDSYRSELITHLWHLLAVRKIDCDISQPLSNSTELWIPTDE